MIREMKRVVKITFPVMMGYVSVGIAFGLLSVKSGIDFFWAILMSFIIYAGSMQFVAIQLIVNGVGIFDIAVMTLFVNIRHMFYGLSFIDIFEQMGKKKLYMIFSLTDETYSLLYGTQIAGENHNEKFLFMIAFFNQIYWIVGTTIGALAGKWIAFDSTGIDFALTALFVVIFVEQWIQSRNHLPAFLGVVLTLLAMVLFGTDRLVIASMAMITLSLFGLRKRIEGK